MLEAVGLGEHVNKRPNQLSGGQRQRVAIARAPTESLDKKSGREVVNLMCSLAKDKGATVLLVTHDNRILDVADRIIHLEDGCLSSFAQSVISSTRHMMTLLSQSARKGELTKRVADMSLNQFVHLLERVTDESRDLLQATEKGRDEAFESMLDQALEAFTAKLDQVLNAERASVFLLDAKTNEFWLRISHEEKDESEDVKEETGSAPVSSALEDLAMVRIAAEVLKSGENLRIDDAYAHPLFNASIDKLTGFTTKTIMMYPLRDHLGKTFAVAQLLNRSDGLPFDDDEVRFEEFTRSIGVILESWWLMSQ